MGTMTGVQLSAPALAGFKAGVGDAVATIQTTLNNQYLTEIAVMFIGFAVIVSLIGFLLLRHKGNNGSGLSIGNGVSDAYYASKYMTGVGANIDKAAKPEFIRAWAKDYEANLAVFKDEKVAIRHANLRWI